MPKFFAAFIFILISNCIFGQNNSDSCTLLRIVRAFISKADSNSIQLSILKNGFTLHTSDTTLKITGFILAFNAEAEDGAPAYFASLFAGNKFDPGQYPVMTKKLEGANTIFFDNISANRGDSCFWIKSKAYNVH